MLGNFIIVLAFGSGIDVACIVVFTTKNAYKSGTTTSESNAPKTKTNICMPCQWADRNPSFRSALQLPKWSTSAFWFSKCNYLAVFCPIHWGCLQKYQQPAPKCKTPATIPRSTASWPEREPAPSKRNRIVSWWLADLEVRLVPTDFVARLTVANVQVWQKVALCGNNGNVAKTSILYGGKIKQCFRNFVKVFLVLYADLTGKYWLNDAFPAISEDTAYFRAAKFTCYNSVKWHNMYGQNVMSIYMLCFLTEISNL